MRVELLSTAGPDGWPAPGCQCASCTRMRAAGRRWEPTRVVVDGVPVERCPRQEIPGGFDVRAPEGGRLLLAAGPGARPEPTERGAYDAVLLDLIGAPEHLALLRRTGAVATKTHIHAVHNDHRISSPAELMRRLRWWTGPTTRPHRTLVLGGTRSGKSAEAELRLAACPAVTYVATGGAHDDDPEWLARIKVHRERRPPWWETVETSRVAQALRMASPADAVLIDGIGSWLVTAMDETGAWDALDAVHSRIDELVSAWRATNAQVVAVSEEVGLSVVPMTPAGRSFQDVLGGLNQRLAAESEETVLVVAGRVLELP